MHIDIHAHLWTSSYLDLLERCGRDTGSRRGLGAGADDEAMRARFETMDAAGVGMQVLSAGPEVATFDDERQAVEVATVLNEQYAELAERHPGRFRAFATLPLPHVDAAVEVTAKALDDLAMVGIGLVTSVLGRPLSDPVFTPLFEELDRRGAVVHLHPAGVAACSPLIADSGLTWLVGAPVEDTVAAVQLIKAGIPSRFPNIRIVVSHLGGMLPMILQRLDNLSPMHAPEMPEPASVAAKRMWYDTVSHGSVPALRCAVETLGAERLLLGTDFPFEKGALYHRAVEHIHDAELSSNETEGILGKTAQSLLGF